MAEPPLRDARRLAVLVERRHLAQAQPAGLCTALRLRGHDVRIVPAEETFDAGDRTWLAESDAVIARGRSSELLSLLRAAERAGLRAPNTASGIALARNKVRLAARLRAGGIPVAALLPSATPPASRPPRERRADALVRMTLLVAGRRVWVAGDAAPAALELEAQPPPDAPMGRVLRDLALLCGRRLGLELFGVECVVQGGEAFAVDVEPFPAYEGIPDVDAALAEQVVASLRNGRV